MFDIIRNKTRSFGIYFMFAAIIVVFAFTFGAISPDQACGGQAGGMQRATYVEVDGEPIDTSLLVL
jgi:hypothetical protein